VVQKEREKTAKKYPRWRDLGEHSSVLFAKAHGAPQKAIHSYKKLINK
jgi:hypothetical protein